MDRIKRLEDLARQVRLSIVEMIGVGKVGHIGGSCSCADIVTALYFDKMKHDPKNPGWQLRDRLVLSKGHSAPAQYACLSLCGYFPAAELKTLKTLGSRLQGHPDRTKLPGIEANTGSLGQGLSISAGLAAAAKLDRTGASVYCIVGDGELAEGQIWEAAMSAAVFGLGNLVAVVDRNNLQATGPTAERFNIERIPDKWRSFGWNVVEIDGHDMAQIVAALDKIDPAGGRPTCIIAHTIKGKGVPCAENVVGFHNGQFTAEQYDEAVRALS